MPTPCIGCKDCNMRQEVMRLVKIHMVKKGDTLYEIAKKHGVTVEELLKLNPGITNPDAIDVGMKVKVPSSMPKPPIGDWLHQHKVVQGDTLWKLAKAWGIQLADMIKVNPHLKNPNVLLTGEIVNIPKAAGGSGEQPVPMPEGPELHHLTGEQPIAGKTFTGPVAGLAETPPMPLPTPIPGKTPTAPIPLPTPIEPIAQPAPLPVPVPLPQPMPPIMEQPKPAYPAPPIHHETVDLFKHYQIPAVEAFKPLPLPKHPEAVLGQMEMPYPGLMQPHDMHHMGYPCPPGTMPIGEMGGYGMPAEFPHAGPHAGLYADFHADVHADLHAQAGAGAFGMGQAPWDAQGVSMPPMLPLMSQQMLPQMPQDIMPMHMMPQQMMPQQMMPQQMMPHQMMPMHMMPQPMPQHMMPQPMPMEIAGAGAPFGMPYGMPAHGSPEPIHGGAYPAGKPCNCGCHGRNFDDQQGYGAGFAHESAVPGEEAARAEKSDSAVGTSSGEGRKETKKAAVRSTAAASGGAAREKARKKRTPKRNPWINR
jgi:LysM repeat protein